MKQRSLKERFNLIYEFNLRLSWPEIIDKSLTTCQCRFQRISGQFVHGDFIA